MVYIITFHGDLPRYGHDAPLAFNTLEESLNHLTSFWGVKREDGGLYGGETVYDSPDPEDDRILIWEVNPPYMRVVWHFSGWHWNPECSDQPGGPLDQGKLPGHELSLYEEAMVGY